ncbi:MAG: cupin domain-containing protein [Fibrobacterota bacterium]
MYLKDFSDFPTYTDEGSINQFCEDILPKKEDVDGTVGIGVCRIEGPGRVVEGCHDKWTQYFVVISGTGTLFYNGTPFAVKARMIIKIPLNTRHYVECKANERIEYIYVNHYTE